MSASIGPWEPLLRLDPGRPGCRRLFLTRSVPDQDKLFEVIDEQFVPKRLTVYDTVCANNLVHQLAAHQHLDRTGEVFFGMLFDLPDVNDFYRPEVAFVPYSVWPRTRPLPDGEAWSVVPELVAEIAGARYPMARIKDYFRAGVRHVWLVRTDAEEVHTYSSPTRVSIMTRTDDLTADPLFPGFRLPLAELFPAAEESTTPSAP